MSPRLTRPARQFLGFLQRIVYAKFFSVHVLGYKHVPGRGGLIIAANHTSHLDMGLIKHALGPAGRELTSLAAQDYFFNNPLYRWYFSNFTNLLAFNRSRGLKESLLSAERALHSGRNLLIFPEGTRTRSGRIGAFKPSLGYMALNFGADVLPVYLSGAYEALPKGKIIPRRGSLKVVFGQVIHARNLKHLAESSPQEDANRLATKAIEDAIRKLERKTR